MKTGNPSKEIEVELDAFLAYNIYGCMQVSLCVDRSARHDSLAAELKMGDHSSAHSDDSCAEMQPMRQLSVLNAPDASIVPVTNH